jgi:hypothetical protein
VQPDLHPLDDEEFEQAVTALLDEAEEFMDQRVRPAANSAWAAYWDVVNVEPEQGGSEVVVPVVRDVAHSLMPDLMEILAGNEAVVEYMGRAVTAIVPGKLPPQVMAEKSTLLAQDVFWQDCKGWVQLHDATLESLVGNVGCLKAYRREKICLYEHEQVDPDPLLLMALNATPGVAVADPTQREDGSTVYPIKKYQVEQELMIEAVSAADLVFSDAVDADSARLIGERMDLRRGDLIAMGIEPEVVGELKADSRSGYKEARQYRQNREDDRQRKTTGVAWAMEPVTVYKLFVQLDADGDGLTERWEVLLASDMGRKGGKPGGKVLRKQKVEGQPYCPFASHRLPGQIHGRTIEQVLGDMQDQRTALRRDTLDNARAINSPMMLGSSGIDAMALANWRKHKFVKETVAGSVRWWQPPPVVQYLLQVDQALEMQQETSTGISRVAMGLDPDALTNVTATAIQGTLGAAQRKMEMVARSIAEGGLKPLYQKLLRLMVGLPPRMVIGSSGGMELVSPDMLDPTFSVRVKVGLGPAAKMARTTSLREVLQLQIQAIAQYGPDNDLCAINHVANTIQDLSAQTGLRYDRYFRPEPEIQQRLAAKAQQPPPPDPKMIEVQGKLQMQGQKQQSDMQATMQKMQAEFARDQQKLQAEFQLKMHELDQKMALRIREQNIEGALESEKIRQGGGDANIPRAN